MNEQWFLLGDIHGSAQPVHYFYQKNKERLSLDSSENFMILLGDVRSSWVMLVQILLSLVRGIINSNQSFQNCHLLLYV